MWEILEHRPVAKQLEALPLEILRRYEKWKDIVRTSGSQGLRMIRGLNDEPLDGEWNGHRSSRLNQQYRVIYRIETHEVLVLVVSVTPHDDRKK